MIRIGQTRSPYFKQTLLFLVTVLLPGSALLLLSARMISQERELAENRSRERREEVGRVFGAALARRLGEIAAQAQRTLSKSVLFLGIVQDDRLVLPWESFEHPAARAPSDESFLAAQTAEFQQGDFRRALDLYRAAAREGRWEGAYARLAAARVLAKLGRADEAEEEVEPLFDPRQSARDEFNVPLSFYAAGQLIEAGRSHERVIALVRNAVAQAPETPAAALFMSRDYLETLRQAKDDKQVEEYRARVKTLLEQYSAWEQTRDLLAGQRLDFASWNRSETKPLWRVLGPEPALFAGMAEGKIIAISADAATRETLSESALALFNGAAPRVVVGPHSQGVWLGDEFPNSQIILSEAVVAALQIRPQLALYFALSILVSGLTFYAAYLWWRDTNRELKLAQLRSDFVASVSHELKTPLTSIQMLTETLRTRPVEPAQQRDYLDLIFSESQRLGRLLKNVLDFSRIEQGTKEYHVAPFNLAETARAVGRAVEQQTREKQLVLAVEAADELMIEGDADAIEQAVLNLLFNAIKYSPECARIELSVARENFNAVIKVRDEGIGIHPRDHERIFERFYRAPEEHNRRIPGTGLGLALVKHIVESHGGRVSVQSAPGKGSTFMLTLPIQPHPAAGRMSTQPVSSGVPAAISSSLTL